MSARAAVVWRLDWDQKIHLKLVHSWSVCWCWLLAGGLSPSHVNLFIGLLECPYHMATGLPRLNDPRTKKMEATLFLYVQALEITHSHFLNILVVMQISRIQCEGEIYKAEPHGGHLGHWLPYVLNLALWHYVIVPFSSAIPLSAHLT